LAQGGIISETGFNWATSFQTWKLPFGFGKESGYHWCFNWATSFQTWKSDGSSKIYGWEIKFQLGHVFSDMEMEVEFPDADDTNILFQLGHVFSDMEIWPGSGRENRSFWVSIGPRLFRHGNSRGRDRRSVVKCCFNWATSFQTWKSASALCASLIAERFQLGHVFSDMEMWLFEYWNSGDSLVSIGPRLFRHGNYPEKYEVRVGSGGVSIGPRLFRHGNVNPAFTQDDQVSTFQLGHVFSDMEIIRRPAVASLGRKVSIGPRLFRHGNVGKWHQ